MQHLFQNGEKYLASLRDYSLRDDVRAAVDFDLQNQKLPIAEAKETGIVELFERRKMKPGGFDRFRFLTQQTRQRYTRDFQACKENSLAKFDYENNLLPVQGPLTKSEVEDGFLLSLYSTWFSWLSVSIFSELERT